MILFTQKKDAGWKENTIRPFWRNICLLVFPDEIFRSGICRVRRRRRKYRPGRIYRTVGKERDSGLWCESGRLTLYFDQKPLYRSLTPPHCGEGSCQSDAGRISGYFADETCFFGIIRSVSTLRAGYRTDHYWSGRLFAWKMSGNFYQKQNRGEKTERHSCWIEYFP